MKFHKRETELNKLKIWSQRAASSSSGTMTMIVGRRRVGKTALLNHAYPVTTELAPAASLYLFVSRKQERLLCEEFVE